MPRVAEIITRNRIALLALAISAAVHAVVFVGMPRRLAAIDEKAAAIYSATLDPAATTGVVVPTQPAPLAAPTPRRVAPRRATRPVPAAGGAFVPTWGQFPELPADLLSPVTPPELLALAQPLAPPPTVEPAPFPVEALPASISISYQITSAFADGRAVYSWQREGDNYRITGEAEAEGFFTLFLEGRIQQESRGTVTESGLRPERFVETRPDNVREGLEFDWPSRQITFSRAGNSTTSTLADNTVDWLSMIFQLAHVPPSGDAIAMQVFTQRKMYQFRLQVLGIEEIEIPLGKVRALHLRHFDPKDQREAVDVWLGLEQHNLPVKMRYPVARNRLMVEQVATRVSVK